ncbi:MAG: HD-GYP domain-containing protein [Proteobacteria bacterium]|nr:MAG: HD-GYP domain-containing protein [Pseudomonadota bacterium]
MHTLLAMAWVVEARDPYTGGHLWRVSRLAETLARRAGLGERDVSRIAIGGFLHDLGKVGIPDAILRKPDRLSDDEFDIVRTHPAVGARLLAGHPLAALAADAVLAHHERPDGRGYPAGLGADDIPQDARIIGICDAFDAMTSARPYRKGMPIDAALAIIRDHLGSQFDRRFGEHFLSLAHTGVLEHIVGHSDDGIPLLDCMMCGPTLVARREQATGDTLFCPQCTGEYRLATGADGKLEARQTGRVGSAADLAPVADSGLIQRFLSGAARRALANGVIE